MGSQQESAFRSQIKSTCQSLWVPFALKLKAAAQMKRVQSMHPSNRVRPHLKMKQNTKPFQNKTQIYNKGSGSILSEILVLRMLICTGQY